MHPITRLVKKIGRRSKKTLCARGFFFLCALNQAGRGYSMGHPSHYILGVIRTLNIRIRHKFSPEETNYLGLLYQSNDFYNRYINKKRLVSWQNYINERSIQSITEDKAIFHSYCNALGIPTASLLGVYFYGSSGLQYYPNRPLVNKADWVNFFDACPTEFVVKPSRGVYGKNILFINKEDKTYSPIALYTYMQSGIHASFIIQECLRNHHGVLAISPKRGLQTVRIVTFVQSKLDVELIFAHFRIIIGENRFDNYQRGLSGNILCNVRLEDGALCTPILSSKQGPRNMALHPETNEPIEGRRLPLWQEACALAKEAALKMLPMRAIGWDIALTPNGPIVVEGNARWDPSPYGDLGPHNRIFLDGPSSFISAPLKR